MVSGDVLKLECGALVVGIPAGGPAAIRGNTE